MWNNLGQKSISSMLTHFWTFPFWHFIWGMLSLRQHAWDIGFISFVCVTANCKYITSMASIFQIEILQSCLRAYNTASIIIDLYSYDWHDGCWKYSNTACLQYFLLGGWERNKILSFFCVLLFVTHLYCQFLIFNYFVPLKTLKYKLHMKA